MNVHPPKNKVYNIIYTNNIFSAALLEILVKKWFWLTKHRVLQKKKKKQIEK